MTTHSSIDATIFGFASQVRRWFKTKNTEWHTEVALTNSCYCKIGCDIFCGDEALMLHTRVFNLWLSVSFNARWNWLRQIRTKVLGKHYNGREFGLSYVDRAISWEFWAREHESSTRDPWWMQGHINMPWSYRWLSTEILSLDLKEVAHRDHWRDRRNWSKKYEEAEAMRKVHSVSHSYLYQLKNGEIQKRTATVCVERRSWGYKWLPFPFHKRTSICVNFDQEIGERVGSWKGGTTGCGYEMKSGETVSATLLRMQAERKFD